MKDTIESVFDLIYFDFQFLMVYEKGDFYIFQNTSTFRCY